MARKQIDEEELWNLYCLIGKGIWHLQYLEIALDMFITVKIDVKMPRSVTQAQGFQLLLKNHRKTLGESLSKAKKHQALDEVFLARLDAFNSERRWLVHRSLVENGDDLYEDEARSAVILRLERFADEAAALHFALSAKITQFVAESGVDAEAVEEAAEARLRTLMGLDSPD